jgi:hypothetical protein
MTWGVAPTQLLGAGVALLVHEISIPLLLTAATPRPLEPRWKRLFTLVVVNSGDDHCPCIDQR